MDNIYVSRTHFEIYSVVYEENGASSQQPMIYVRDCQSLSGTTVNGLSIGSKLLGTSRGYLLSHGDVVAIAPYWQFEVQLNWHSGWTSPLRDIQKLEAQVNEPLVISTRFY